MDYEKLPVKIFPNPASKYVNVRIDEPAMTFDFIRIVNLVGNVLYTDKLSTGIRDFQISINLRHGIYLIQMGTGNLTLFTQKLIVND